MKHETLHDAFMVSWGLLHAHTSTSFTQEMLLSWFPVLKTELKVKGQEPRAITPETRSAPSPGQYETKPEFREDVISMISSLPSTPVRIRSLCRNLKECRSLQTLRNHITPECFHPLPEVISRSSFIDHTAGHAYKYNWKAVN